MEDEHSANMVLDPQEMFTYFAVLPKIDTGCYTTVTYASLVGITSQSKTHHTLFQ